jgi:hypothetical protein
MTTPQSLAEFVARRFSAIRLATGQDAKTALGSAAKFTLRFIFRHIIASIF